VPVRAPHEPPSSRSRIAPPPELVALTARSPPVPIPPSGNAPASKLLTYGTAAASLLTHYSRAHHRVGLTPRGLFARGELLSRWLTSQFAFTAPGEACFGLYLLHALRDVERVRGTRAHATRLLIAAVVSLGIQTLLCADARLVRWLGLGGSSNAFIQNFETTGFAPGPHSLVAALLFPGFLATQPTTQTFTVAGVRFGDKVFTLLAGARLFWSHGARSVVPAFAGVVGSLVAEWAVTGRGWTPPEWACALTRATLGRALGVDGGGGGGRRGGGRAAATVLRPRPRPRGRRDAAADNRRVGHFEPAPAPPPPPGAVETLTSMGFDEHDARRALGMCGNDLEAATDALLADAR
jgi:hypothetical protein